MMPSDTPFMRNDMIDNKIETKQMPKNYVGVDTRRPRACSKCIYGIDDGICRNQKSLCGIGMAEGRTRIGGKA